MAIQHTPTLQLPYPQPTDSADPPRDIAALANAIDPLGITPVGALLLWPAVNPPGDLDGTGRALWLLCNGQQVSAATYPKLATVLGQAGGNVTVPDMRDLFPVGASAALALLSTGGAAAVALTGAQMPTHTHTGTAPDHTHYVGVPDHLHNTGTLYAGDHAHGAGSIYVSGHSRYGGGYGSTGEAVAFANSTSSAAGGGTSGSGAVGLGGATGAADRALAVNSGGSNNSLAFTTSGANASANGATHENRPPYRALNFIIRAG